MKRSIFAGLFALLFAGLLAVGCGDGGGAKCDPACATGEVCISHDSKYECAKTCEKDEDCTSPMVCHKDEGTPHCGEAE